MYTRAGTRARTSNLDLKYWTRNSLLCSSSILRDKNIIKSDEVPVGPQSDVHGPSTPPPAFRCFRVNCRDFSANSYRRGSRLFLLESTNFRQLSSGSKGDADFPGFGVNFLATRRHHFYLSGRQTNLLPSKVCYST